MHCATPACKRMHACLRISAGARVRLCEAGLAAPLTRASTPIMLAETKAEGRCVGGWPRISSMVNALRLQAAKEGAAFFFLDAGDEV